MRLDHLAIVAETLEEGVTWAQDKFDMAFGPIGHHDYFGTHNRLLGLEGDIYIEVITVDPNGHSQVPRWFGLDAFSGPPRLANWICEPDDFDAALVHGMRPVPMQRGDFRWTMGVPVDGALPMGGGYPTLLQWHTDAPPGVRMASSGFALDELVVSHPHADDIKSQLNGVLNDQRVRFQAATDIGLSATLKKGDRTVIL